MTGNASTGGYVMSQSVPKPRSGTDGRFGGENHRWLVLGVVSIAQLMIVLDVTIMNIALPSAQRDLAFSNDLRQWIVTAYSLAFGSLLLVGGRLADILGRKVTLMIGLIGFATASAFGGAAQNFGMLATGRAIQGVFAALLAPSALSVLATTFQGSDDRPKAFAIFGAIVGAGSAIGLLLGGVLTEYLDWRWCLYVNLIFAVIALAGTIVLLPHRRGDDAPNLDWPGTITAVAGLFCVVYGLSNAETHPWSAPQTWAFLVGGVALLVLFVVVEARAAHPLLPLRIPGERNRGGSYLAVLITGIGMFGCFLFLTYYLQDMLNYSPVRTGLAFLPMVACIVIAAQLGTIMLLPRLGPQIPIAAGMLLGALGMVWLTGIHIQGNYPVQILGPICLVGLGMGLIMAPAMNVATWGVRPADAGVASSVVNTGQQVGGSIGIALLSSLATSAVTRFVAGKRPTPLLQAQATLHGYTTAFWWSAGIFAAGAVICGLLLRPGKLKPVTTSGSSETESVSVMI
jgi:EmrB/QacA subfamily drug resistance transporter